MMNNNLHKAKTGKNDEFYTQLSDIERELRHYREHFKNKIIYCNCDDPKISNFFHFFAYNFKFLGLKKLIVTCYKNSNPDLFSQNLEEKSVYIEYNGEMIDNENVPDYAKTHIKELNCDGDFRQPECIELLKQADIVVTNPPFSLFREYVAQLVEYDKKFLIVGNMNALTYKEIFKLIKDNKLWTGYGFSNGNAFFKTPHKKEFAEGVYDEQTQLVKFRNCLWYTNLDIRKRYEDIILWKTYYGNEEEYPKYDNYDAIEISKVAHIPVDYAGAMGVPITFIDKFNPKQFKVLGIMNTGEENKGIRYEGTTHGRPLVNGIEKYLRVLIKNKKL